MAARELLLIATGPSKAAPIKAALEGPITTMCPASAIQRHLQATVILDEAAATGLTLANYHRLTHTQRPPNGSSLNAWICFASSESYRPPEAR